MVKKTVIFIAVICMFFAASVPVAGEKYRGLNEFYYKRNSGKRIALTFDDGPHPRYTPKILEILSEYNVKATFFIIGQNVEYYGSERIGFFRLYVQ